MNELYQQRLLLQEEILRPIGGSDNLPLHQITGFLAAKGERYKKDLMVVGRAVNGWELEGNDYPFPSQLIEVKQRECFSGRIYDSVSGKECCAMEWVTNQWQHEKKYNTVKSAFWRVIRQIALSLKIAEQTDRWSSYLVWSNLYKVAPIDGGNPDERLCNAQFEGCRTLLYQEIKDYRPTRLLFLTGWDWARDFLEGRGEIREVDNEYVKASGTFGSGEREQCHIVVAVHPQSKKEDRWVEEVISEYNTLCHS